MKPEDLFLAMSEVEEEMLLRSEWTMHSASAENREDKTMKKPRRILRNLLIAAAFISTLAVTAFAAAGFLLFDNPAQMLSYLYGDATGFDHKDVTYIEDPWKPESPIENPAYDRVPADETVVQEDVAPYVSPVGQVLCCDTRKLTIDALMYDAATQTGLLTYTLEDTEGVQSYYLQPNGELTFEGIQPLYFSHSGESYLIQDQTTDTKVTAVYYFNYDPAFGGETMEIHFTSETPDDEDFENILQEVRSTLSAGEARQQAREALGEEQYAMLMDAYSGAALDEMCCQAVAGREYQRYYQEHMENIPRLNIALDQQSSLDYVTAGEGSVTVSPIAFRIDVADLEFLHTAHDGSHWVSGYNVDDVVILFDDGTEYLVKSDNVENTTIGVITSAEGATDGSGTVLTYMFNRVIDVDKIASVLVNGVEMKLDP